MCTLGPGQDLEITRGHAATTREMKWSLTAINERVDTTRIITPQPTAQGTTNGTTPQTMLSGPASGHESVAAKWFVNNSDTVADTVSIGIAGGDPILEDLTLEAGDKLTYHSDGSWDVRDNRGRLRVVGQKGDPGDGEAAYSGENKDSVTVSAGMAVAVHSSGTGFVRARANAVATKAVGLLRADTIATVGGDVQTTGMFQLADWTAIIGSTSLTARTNYYLDPTTAGKLTATAPTTVGQIVQLVGVSVSADTLDLTVEPPILL